MKAKSIKGTPPEAIAKQITECTAQEFNPTLAIVFMPSQKEDTEKMIAVMNEKEVQFLGVTTGGKFINSELASRGGYFSAGEIGKSKRRKTEFHNNTCCVVVLKEK